MASRRAFIAGLCAAGLLSRPTWANVGSPAYLAAGRKPDGSYCLCGLSKDGLVTFELPLPARGHAAAAHPTRPEAVAFARRPGTYAVVLDCETGLRKASLDAPSGRHFYGHGAFSADGRYLFTTENDFDAARGMVGVWDVAKNYARVGEFSSGGVGPHDIRLLPGGATLVVANGGIETHPETGRTKLNLPTMQSNLSYLNLDGGLLEQMTLAAAYRLNSIRHLSTDSAGNTAFAMQWQGDRTADVPLLGVHRPGTGAPPKLSSPSHSKPMVGYAGSVALSSASGQVAISSPRGGKVQVYHLTDLALADTVAFEDACGVAASDDGFFVTSGLGYALPDGKPGSSSKRRHAIAWDNHLVPVVAPYGG